MTKDQKKSEEELKDIQEKELDEELKETFPASDPGQHNGHA